MRVATVSFHNCIRVYKQVVGLAGHDIEVHSILNRMANNDLMGNYDSLGFYMDKEQYREKLSRLAGVDVLHIHNEPNWLGTIAGRTRPDMPIVFDAHDLDSVRQGQISDAEKECFERLHGFVFPSQGYRQICQNLYGLPDEACRVIYSMCNRHMMVTRPLPRLRGICYEGGIEAIPQNEPDFMGRDYRKIACHLVEWGIPITFFGANHHFIDAYVDTGAICFPPHNYYHLIAQMSRYDWGLVGNQVKCSQRKNAMPNKLFEYMAAGIPIIVMNAEEAGKFVEEHGVGVYIEDVEDIRKIYDQHEKYKLAVLAKRHKFVMEEQIPDILSLYDYAKERCRAKSPASVVASGLGKRGPRICDGTKECGCAFCNGVGG